MGDKDSFEVISVSPAPIGKTVGLPGINVLNPREHSDPDSAASWGQTQPALEAGKKKNRALASPDHHTGGHGAGKCAL